MLAAREDCNDRSKQPLIPARSGGHGLHDATADPEVIKRWFQDHPTANIGLTTSVSFDVIDLDGEAAIDALEEARARRAGRDTDSRCPARRRPGYQDQAARHRRTAQACARSRSTSRERPPTTTRHGSGGSAHSRIGATLMRPNRIGSPTASCRRSWRPSSVATGGGWRRCWHARASTPRPVTRNGS
jgi:Bifunctional DNA primase/polymerase, N-terminal